MNTEKCIIAIGSEDVIVSSERVAQEICRENNTFCYVKLIIEGWDDASRI